MSELLIDDNDPRIVHQTLAEGVWKTVTRELIRIDGVIWYRLTTVYGTPITIVSEWQVMSGYMEKETHRTWNGESAVVSLTKNPEFEKCHALLDRHDLRLEHTALTGNRAVSEGWL